MAKETEVNKRENIIFFAPGCCVPSQEVIWMMITLFIFTTVLCIFCCCLCTATRWAYKRRSRKKIEELKKKHFEEDTAKRRHDERIRASMQKYQEGIIRNQVTCHHACDPMQMKAGLVGHAPASAFHHQQLGYKPAPRSTRDVFDCVQIKTAKEIGVPAAVPSTPAPPPAGSIATPSVANSSNPPASNPQTLSTVVSSTVATPTTTPAVKPDTNNDTKARRSVEPSNEKAVAEKKQPPSADQEPPKKKEEPPKKTTPEKKKKEKKKKRDKEKPLDRTQDDEMIDPDYYSNPSGTTTPKASLTDLTDTPIVFTQPTTLPRTVVVSTPATTTASTPLSSTQTSVTPTTTAPSSTGDTTSILSTLTSTPAPGEPELVYVDRRTVAGALERIRAAVKPIAAPNKTVILDTENPLKKHPTRPKPNTDMNNSVSSSGGQTATNTYQHNIPPASLFRGDAPYWDEHHDADPMDSTMFQYKRKSGSQLTSDELRQQQQTASMQSRASSRPAGRSSNEEPSPRDTRPDVYSQQQKWVRDEKRRLKSPVRISMDGGSGSGKSSSVNNNSRAPSSTFYSGLSRDESSPRRRQQHDIYRRGGSFEGTDKQQFEYP